MKKEIKGFIIGLIVVIFITGGLVYAGGITKTIKVKLNSVNITVNGQKVAADNILYNGTVYVPLRAVAEMLGKNVEWNAATNTANINDKDKTEIISSPKSVQPITTYKTYINSEAGYSVDYPDSWVVDRQDTDSVWMTYFYYPNKTFADVAISVLVAKEPDLTLDLSSDSTIQSINARLKSAFKVFEPYEIQKTTLFGSPAFFVKAHLTNEYNIKNDCQYICFKQAERLCWIEIDTLPGHLSDYKNYFDAFLKSFKTNM